MELSNEEYRRVTVPLIENDTRISETLPGATIKVESPDGSVYLTVVEKGGSPYQIHIMIGRTGTQIRAWADATARLMTRLIRLGVPISSIIEEISGITSDKSRRFGDGMQIRSGPEGVSHALYIYLQKDGKP